MMITMKMKRKRLKMIKDLEEKVVANSTTSKTLLTKLKHS